jgi:hypothetical protein
MIVTVRHMDAATAVSVTRGSFKGQFQGAVSRGSFKGQFPRAAP